MLNMVSCSWDVSVAPVEGVAVGDGVGVGTAGDGVGVGTMLLSLAGCCDAKTANTAILETTATMNKAK